MKTQDLDNELKSLIKEIKLESPGNDFTVNVMNRVFEEKTAMEKVKDNKILGKGFWIILLLFVILIAAMFVFSSTDIPNNGALTKLLNRANNGNLSQEVHSVFSNLGTLPLSIGGILLATSILIFIDRFLPQFMTHYLSQKTA
jgi:hypothetical protein